MSKKRVSNKSVKIIEHSETDVFTCKKYPVTIPLSKVSADFQNQYGSRAYDFKLVAKNEFESWFIVIAANKKYENSKEELVVPIDYAIMHSLAQKTGSALVVIPYDTSTMIGVVKDKEVVYVQEIQFSIYAQEKLNGVEIAISSILDEIRQSKIVPSMVYIANPTYPVPNYIISMFNNMDINPDVIPPGTIDIEQYNGDLSLNSKYAFRNRKSITTFLFSMAQNRRKIVSTALAMITMFMWVYFPASEVIRIIDTSYTSTSAEIQQTILQIQQQKQIFKDTLQNIENKKSMVENYNASFKKINNPDLTPIIKVILSNPNVTSISYSGGTFTITFTANSTADIDSYFKTLLQSGYFSVLQPVVRTSKPSTYSIQVVINK